MAKKKTETESPDAGLVEQLEREITKQYGDGIIVTAQDVAQERRTIIPTCPSVDAILGGGIPEGCWVSLSGPEKVGKTVLALTTAAQAQKPEFGSRVVYYANVEERIKMRDLQGIAGLDLDPSRFRLIQSSRSTKKVLTGQDHLDIAEKILKSQERVIYIIDSLSALCDSKEMEGGIGTETRGGGAKMISQFVRIAAAAVPVMNSIVIGIVHLINDTSGRTQGKVERACQRWLYQADVRLRATHAQAWTIGAERKEKQIGQKVYWKAQCTAIAPPGGRCESWLRYGVGMDHVYEIVQAATDVGLIDKPEKSAWFTLEFLRAHPELLDKDQDPPKVQGGEKVYKLLTDNPTWMTALRQDLTAALVGGGS